MVPVARRNLFSEKGRFAISVAGIAFAVLLILIVLALYRGISRTGQTFRELPGQLWVVQPGTTDPFHSVSLIEQARLASVTTTPGISAVVPVLSRQMAFEAGGSEVSARLMALDVPSTVALPPAIRERYVPPPGAIIIDRTLSRKTGLTAGDAVDFGTEPLSLSVQRVAPSGAEALSQFVFLNFQDARRIFGVGELVNYGMVILKEGTEPDAAAQAIAARDPGLQVFTTDAFVKAFRKEIDESFLPIIAILLGIGFVVGAAVVGLTFGVPPVRSSV